MTYNFFASEPPHSSLPGQSYADMPMPDVMDRDSLPVAKNGFHIDQLEAVSFEGSKRNNIPARFVSGFILGCQLYAVEISAFGRLCFDGSRNMETWKQSANVYHEF